MTADDVDVPSGWAVATVGDLVSFVRGVTYEKSAARDVYFPDSVGIVRAGNIGPDGLNTESDLVFVPGGLASAQQRLRRGDVVVAMSSGSASVVGKGAIVMSDLPNRSFGAFCGVFRPKTSEAGTLLGRYFASAEYRTAVSTAAAGVNINNLRREHILDLPIMIPPTMEQRRIASRLNEFGARGRKAREALNEIPALLEKLKQSILATAFRGDLTADWRATHPNVESASMQLDRIRAERRRRWEEANPRKRYAEPAAVETEALGDVPASWSWATWEELTISSLYGPRFAATNYVSDGVPTVRTTDMLASGLIRLKADVPRVRLHQDRLLDWVLQDGDILVTRSGTIGRCALFRGYDDEIVLPSAYLIRFRPTCTDDLPEWLLTYLLSPLGQSALGAGATAVTLSNVNATTINGFRVPFPPLEEQREIRLRVSALRQLDSLLGRCSDAGALLSRLDQSILAKAFRGELVPQDPTDEPADVLLARIKAQAEAVEQPVKEKRGRKPKPS